MGIHERYFGDEVVNHLDEPGRLVLESWSGWRDGKHVPLKTKLEPLDFPRALPGIQLVEAVQPPEKFIYRLVGTREVDIRGLDPTGQPVAKGFFGSSAEEVLANYHAVIEARLPMCDIDSFRKVNGVNVVDISLFLPLMQDGEIKFILVYSYQKSPDSPFGSA